MEQNFTCQGKTWTRREIPGCPVTIAQRHSEGVYCPTISTTWVGPHILSDGERKLTVERSTVTDAGKLGTSLTYIEKATAPGAELDCVLYGMGWKRA